MTSASKSHSRPIWPILVAVFCAVFAANLNTSTINLAVPTFIDVFHTGMGTMQWAVTGYMMAIGIGSPLAGFLISRYGSKHLFLWTLLGFTIGCILCSLSFNPATLIASRIIQGFSGGIMLPVTLTLLYRSVQQNQQAMSVSLWEAAGWLGPAVGPVVSGICLQYLNWRWLFLLNLPLLFLSILFIWRYASAEQPDQQRKLDIPSALLSAAGSFTILFAFSKAAAWGLFNAGTLILLLLGSCLLLWFAKRQLGIDSPLLEFRVFRFRTYAVSVLLLGLINAALFAAVYFVPFYLQTAQGIPASKAGFVMLPSSIVMVLLLPVVGKLYARLGAFKLSLSGITLLAIGTLMLTRLDAASEPSFFILWTVVRNIGIAFSSMPLMNAGLSRLPKELIGHASSMTSWIRQCMGSLSIAAFTAYYTWRSGAAGTTSPESITTGVQDVFLLVTVMLACMLPPLLLIRKKLTPAK